MAFKRASHFALDTVVGCDEVGAHQEQEQVGSLKFPFNLSVQFATSQDVAIIPGLNTPFPCKVLEVDVQPIKRGLVAMRIRNKCPHLLNSNV